MENTNYPMSSKPSLGTILRELPKQGYSHVNKLYSVSFTINRYSDVIKGFFFNDSKNLSHLICIELLVDDEMRAKFDKKNLTQFNNMITFFDETEFYINKSNQWTIRCWYDNDCVKHVKLFMLEEIFSKNNSSKITFDSFSENITQTYHTVDSTLTIRDDSVVRLGNEISFIVPLDNSNKTCTINGDMFLEKILFTNIMYDGSVIVEVTLNDIPLFNFKLSDPLLEFPIRLLKFDVLNFRFIGITNYVGFVINGKKNMDKEINEVVLPFSQKTITLLNEGQRTIPRF